MKAERQQEPKTSTSSKGPESASAFFQQYGSRVLLGIILCLLAYILVKNHYRDKENKADNAAKALGGALYTLNELRNIPPRLAPDDLAKLRRDYAREVESSITEATANTEDPKILAQAWIVRGDLNWELANFPALPGAATRPTDLGPAKPVDTYLSDAADAYNKVLQPPLNADHLSVLSARYSLGMIAENRGEWAKAKDCFQQVADDSAADEKFHEWAKISLDALKILEKPVYLGSDLPPRTSGKPLDFGPELPSNLTTGPTTAPAPTTAAAPTTAPSTQPAAETPTSPLAPFTLLPATNPAKP